MRRNAVLCRAGGSQPGSATVTLTDDGQVELLFCEHPEGLPHAFNCSLSGLLDVILGFQKDLTTESATCKLSRGHGRIIMSVGPVDGPQTIYLVNQDIYTNALIKLLHVKTSQDLAIA